MTNPADRRDTCIHEAGHAVASVVLRQPVEYVSIRPGKTFSGLLVSAPHPLADDLDLGGVTQQPAALRADVERRVIVMLAGSIAAHHFGPLEAGYEREPVDEVIAQQALADLGSRLTELLLAHEESEEPSEGDESNAWDLAGALAGQEASSFFYLEWLRHEAQALVLRYQGAIQRVADALERHAVLQGDQVAALVYPHGQGESRNAPTS